MPHVEPVVACVGAPRVFVFQALTAYGDPSPIWPDGRTPEVVDRRGAVLTVRFVDRALGRPVPSVQRVRLQPPERIVTETIEGVRPGLRTEVRLRTDDAGTLLEYSADIPSGTGPFARLRLRWLVEPRLRRDMRHTLARWRVTIEAAARASGRLDAPSR